MDTGRRTSHTGAWEVGGYGMYSKGWGNWGGIAIGEIPNVDDGAMDATNHHHGMFIAM